MYCNFILLIGFVALLSTQICLGRNDEELHKTKFPPCKACKVFTESFKKGQQRTEKGRYEGGDAAWEETKLGSYSKSEIRLTEILEDVCSDIEEGKNQCYSIAEEHDTAIETWWLKDQDDEPDFFKYFCIDTLKQCCPEDHFGINCMPCLGYPDNVCSNHGRCKGSGTRKGNGECSCEPGYAGKSCNACAVNYFEAYNDGKKILCSQCHPACDGPCSKGGPTGCEKCKPGYITDTEKGCVDINECLSPNPPCSPLKFCVNTEGSFKCLDCDRACAGCTGDGPDMCIQCAKDYILSDKFCVDSDVESRKNRVYLSRYLTYLGLCVATCIVLHKNMTVAAFIGISVAIYIALSEYVVNKPPTPKTDNIAEQLFKATN